MRYWAYIDEAGDRGTGPQASRHFVMSAVMVRDDDHAEARASLAALREELGRRPGQVLHFRRLNHGQRLHAAKALPNLPTAAVASVVICKEKVDEHWLAGTRMKLKTGNQLYLRSAQLLLERVSWFARDNGGGEVITTFAAIRRFPVGRLHDYRATLEEGVTSIHWPSLRNHLFRMAGTSEVELLQVADIAASSVYRAVECDEFGYTEPRYLNQFQSSIYRRAGGKVTSYGLKVFPLAEGRPGGSLAWLGSL